MAITSSKIAKFSLALGLFAFIILAVLGLAHASGIKLNENGEMNGCIFTGQTMLCKMGIIEHISRWHSMFTAVPQEPPALLTAILIILTAVWIALSNLSPRLDAKTFSELRLYLARQIELPTFDPLRRAFSRGTLHPKIYESIAL